MMTSLYPRGCVLRLAWIPLIVSPTRVVDQFGSCTLLLLYIRKRKAQELPLHFLDLWYKTDGATQKQHAVPSIGTSSPHQTDKMTDQQFLCANWSPDSTGCKKNGRYTCKDCRLIVVRRNSPLSCHRVCPSNMLPLSVLRPRVPKVALANPQAGLSIKSRKRVMAPRLVSRGQDAGLRRRRPHDSDVVRRPQIPLGQRAGP